MQRSASVTLERTVPPVETNDPETWPVGTDTWPPDAAWGPWGHDRHAHPYGQLVYAASGSCRIDTPTGLRVVDEQRAVWIPRGVMHSARFDDDFCPVVLTSDARAVGPVRDVPVCPAVRAELLSCQRDPRRSGDVLVSLLGAVARPTPPRRSPLTPSGPLTAPIAAALADDPAHPCTLEEWAQRLHVSTVSIRRAFLTETGVPFSQWRTRVRLDAAVARLRAGEPVTTVAHAVGLSHNGLLAACRRHLGMPPSALRTADADHPSTAG